MKPWRVPSQDQKPASCPHLALSYHERPGTHQLLSAPHPESSTIVGAQRAHGLRIVGHQPKVHWGLSETGYHTMVFDCVVLEAVSQKQSWSVVSCAELS